MADSQVYEHILMLFCKKEITFEKLPVADSQVYEWIFNAFLQLKKLLKNYLWLIAESMSAQ